MARVVGFFSPHLSTVLVIMRHLVSPSLISSLAGASAVVISALSLIIACEARSPSPEPILQLIETEATAVMTRDCDTLAGLYTQDAFVRDALGEIVNRQEPQPLAEPTSWYGQDQIRMRCVNLPEFSSLRHLGALITFDATKKRATAIASTNGVIEGESGPIPIFNVGGEKWTFEKIGPEWKITSFTYNVP